MKFKILFLIVLFLVPLSAKAAVFYVLPQSQTVYQRDTFVVSVGLDTEGENINAAEVKIEFPVNLLAAVDINRGESIFDLWIKPSI